MSHCFCACNVSEPPLCNCYDIFGISPASVIVSVRTENVCKYKLVKGRQTLFSVIISHKQGHFRHTESHSNDGDLFLDFVFLLTVHA